MNKAFEKILERLDKPQFNIGCGACPIKEKCDEVQEAIDDEMTDLCAETMRVIAKEIVQEVAEEYKGGWIPVKTRPMTEEEKEYYSEFLVDENGIIYECPLPDDGQEVLITTKYGSVQKVTFYTDCGNYFEEYEDYDEVIAWMPLPEAYKESE